MVCVREKMGWILVLSCGFKQVITFGLWTEKYMFSYNLNISSLIFTAKTWNFKTWHEAFLKWYNSPLKSFQCNVVIEKSPHQSFILCQIGGGDKKNVLMTHLEVYKESVIEHTWQRSRWKYHILCISSFYWEMQKLSISFLASHCSAQG